MPELPPIVILGQSVRALAESARGLARRVVGIDCFADLDTRAACARVARAPDCSADALAGTALALAAEEPGAELVLGGGLDARADLLHRLGRRLRLRGNGPDVAGVLADPGRWFRLLARLDIPHPEVALQRPSAAGQWLLKHTASCGGQGVSPAVGVDGPAPCGAYFQRRIAGEGVSAVFAADGREARVVAFSRLLPGSGSGSAGYGYAGAIGWPEPGPVLERTVSAWAGALTRALVLRGLNGIDLVLREQDRAPLLLELNARPTATCELHPERLLGGAVRCHLDACAGRLPPRAAASRTRGIEVIRAGRSLPVPAAIWPHWCSDRPSPGTRIAAGEPLCSVHADGADHREVSRLLRERAAFIHRFIDNLDSWAA